LVRLVAGRDAERVPPLAEPAPGERDGAAGVVAGGFDGVLGVAAAGGLTSAALGAGELGIETAAVLALVMLGSGDLGGLAATGCVSTGVAAA
jgi:hypothetical protein